MGNSIIVSSSSHLLAPTFGLEMLKTKKCTEKLYTPGRHRGYKRSASAKSLNFSCCRRVKFGLKILLHVKELTFHNADADADVTMKADGEVPQSWEQPHSR